MLYDSNGAVIADTSPVPGEKRPAPSREINLVENRQQDAAISVESSPQGPEVIISLPFLFKGKYAGQLTAFLVGETLNRNFVSTTAVQNKRTFFLVRGTTLLGSKNMANQFPELMNFSSSRNLNTVNSYELRVLVKSEESFTIAGSNKRMFIFSTKNGSRLSLSG